MEWLIIIGDFLLGLFCFWIGKQTVKPIEQNNSQLLLERKKLETQLSQLEKNYADIGKQVQISQTQLKNKEKEIIFLKEVKKDLENDIDIMKEGAKSQAQTLYQNQVIQMNNFFEQDREKLEAKYKLLIQENEAVEQDIKDNRQQLKSLQETRAAVITAAQQEKIISENKSFYCLILPPQDQGDIQILKSILQKISKPRSVLMTIWQAYYQPIAKKKFPQILGKSDICGVYKITNQQTGECYIGQARDIRRRFMDHAKAGIGIDTPQGNQLYAAMLEYGLDNFSFELLLECKPEELNEKEKYFIQLYNSDAVGYNVNKGVS